MSEKIREVFDKLRQQKEELLLELEPFQEARNSILREVDKLQGQEKEIIASIRSIHERMAVVDYQISALAKALNGTRLVAELK